MSLILLHFYSLIIAFADCFYDKNVNLNIRSYEKTYLLGK